ncbi:MAG: 30S ribosomal protein S5 [Candidatus Vogelbacteria bacterium]|nr:30S ribosomal protein S5 [Candidatus Vogelbacteria bacterium]
METNHQPQNRGKRPARGRPGRADKPKSEYDQKILAIRRVVRVVRGGRRFSFSVVICIGNRRGKVGLGVGKGADVSLAIEKALREAKKRLMTLQLTKHSSLPHELRAKFGASRVILRPVRGRGLAAGSAARIILGLAGVHDVSAKIISKSKNKLNNGRAVMQALETLAV